MDEQSDIILIFKIEENKDWNGEDPFSEVECSLTIQTKKKVLFTTFLEMHSSFRIGLELYSILIDRFKGLDIQVDYDLISEISVDASKDIELGNVLTLALDFENISTKGHSYER